jgi:hypothetical protein
MSKPTSQLTFLSMHSPISTSVHFPQYAGMAALEVLTKMVYLVESFLVWTHTYSISSG